MPERPGSRWNSGRLAEIGARVMVRRHLRDGETSHLYTDVLGHVVGLDPALVVRREDGAEVTIPDDDIAVLKVLPARTVRARDIREREYACALGWACTERELVDGWLCRTGDDWSYRRDSAVPVLPWASAAELDGVRDWYAERGLPLRIAATDRLVDLDRLRLDGAPVSPERLEIGRELHLCTGDSHELARVDPEPGTAVELVNSPADDWLALYHGTAGLDPARVRPAMLATAALVDGEPAPGGEVVFARLDLDGALAAISRGTVTAGPDGVPRLGVSCVETSPDRRRRGLAEVLTGALARWGLERGAEEAYLHVFDDNAGGRALWGKIGLVPHHGSRYVTIR